MRVLPIGAFCLLLLLVPGPSPADDLPVGVDLLALRSRSGSVPHRSLTWSVRDAAVAAPFADPSLGVAFVLHGSSAPGQCHGELLLDPALWRPLGRDGTTKGYRYVERWASGSIRILIRPGRIRVAVRGDGWPCELSAPRQQLPIQAELRFGGDRFCGELQTGAFDERRNATDRFLGRAASAPAACGDADLTVANLNILHGFLCNQPATNCRLPERIELLFDWLVASGCPDLVTLQEVVQSPGLGQAIPLVEGQLARCPFPYERVFLPSVGIDEELILSRYPVLETNQIVLHGGFRKALHARVDHPVGPTDVVTTHLASGADGGGSPCGPSCPVACTSAGAVTNRDCQAVQLAAFVESVHDVDAPAVVTGDFNDEPGSFTYDQFAGRGWIDTHLAAGNPECNPGTGIGCTSGRASLLAELESPAANVDERIDYIFLVPPGPASSCSAQLDPAADLDGDGAATRIFADDPNPFAPACGPTPLPPCWPSDHEGAELDLACN